MYSRTGNLTLDPLNMKKRTFSLPAKTVKIVTPSLERDCTVIGAATLALKDIFKSPEVISS